MGLRVELKKWNKEAQRSKPNTTHGKKMVPANYINTTIQDYINTAERLFLAYTELPTLKRFKNDFNIAVNRGRKRDDTLGVLSLYNQFLSEEGTAKQWADGIYTPFYTLQIKLSDYDSNALITDIDIKWIEGLQNYIVQECKLANNTANKQIGKLIQFLIWCNRNGYNVNESVLTYRPTLKEIKKTVIFLTWEEVMRVYYTEMPSKILTEVKDVFLLSCFTSLRHSDLLNLQPEDIKEDHIEIVTIKTLDPLRIELNDYSRNILDKYDN